MYEKLYLEGNARIRWYLLQRTGGGNEAYIMGDCDAWYCFELDWGKGF